MLVHIFQRILCTMYCSLFYFIYLNSAKKRNNGRTIQYTITLAINQDTTLENNNIGRYFILFKCFRQRYNIKGRRKSTISGKQF